MDIRYPLVPIDQHRHHGTESALVSRRPFSGFDGHSLAHLWSVLQSRHGIPAEVLHTLRQVDPKRFLFDGVTHRGAR